MKKPEDSPGVQGPAEERANCWLEDTKCFRGVTTYVCNTQTNPTLLLRDVSLTELQTSNRRDSDTQAEAYPDIHQEGSQTICLHLLCWVKFKKGG